jgi:hypothetical protein
MVSGHCLQENCVDKVLFLSGTTRGSTLEEIGRSFGRDFEALGIGFMEISLLDQENLLDNLKRVNFEEIKFVFSWASMGLGIRMRDDNGKELDLWHEIGVPFITVHGDSPVYFFDRHVVRDSKVVTFYSFSEHCALRKRLPHVNGPVDTVQPGPLNKIPIDQLDWERKKSGKILFLKNGKDPARLKLFWSSCLEARPLQAILDLAAELESDLDSPTGNQIDDLVTHYFLDQGFDIDRLLKLRLFFVAQLDDYLRAVKCTRMAEALMDFPIEIRGNEWGHLDFTGKKATYIDECDYAKSIDLIRNSFGLIDVSPNTVSLPHDRFMRACGAHTFCLTNEQAFLDELPHSCSLGFRFEKESLQEKAAYILDHKASAIEMGIEVAAAYGAKHPSTETPLKMLEYASLVKLDNLKQRPLGSQDFFVWPPARL